MLKQYIFIIGFFLGISVLYGQNIDSADIFEFSLEQLMDLKVTTASLKEEEIANAPSNITVITKEMIKQRGYQTLVEVCEDIPGFDFLSFDDGGGEYPTYNLNRGLGSVGNEKILIMVDGIIQNHISYNWSSLWNFENLLAVVERIEIIQGPGSVIYGAQAYTGVIHFITNSSYNGVEAKTFIGSNFTRGIDVVAGKSFTKDFNVSLAFRKYDTDGDNGDRYDPGGYYHGLKYPLLSLQDYDSLGKYVEGAQSPKGGTPIPEGFQTWNDSYSIWTKLRYKDTEFGFYLWDRKAGNASTYLSYEYDITNKNSMNHSNAYHIYIKNKTAINSKLFIESAFINRINNTLPETGFEYNYRFIGLKKNYQVNASQVYIEERAVYKYSDKTDFLVGIKKTYSVKTPRIVNIGNVDMSYSSEELSSWDIANNGGGLGIKRTVPVYFVDECAGYALWNNRWASYLLSSFGVRYDYSDEYGSIMNPRLALIYRSGRYLWIKGLFGKAFRQPSIYELTDEFRGNPDLQPEKMTTYEIELNKYHKNGKFNVKLNGFYSISKDYVDMLDDVSKPALQRFENKGKLLIIGTSMELWYRLNNQIMLTGNYLFMQGKFADSLKWGTIERTAAHKVNLGCSLNFFHNKVHIDCRSNIVGKRKAQSTNKWLNKYENGYAPAYQKINLVLGYKLNKHFEIQCIIKNLLNEQYYGIGREAGAGMIDEYDYISNPNPDGFVPPYHPQPGRTVLFNLLCTF